MANDLKRLGLIIPSVNVVIEQDLRRFLPAGTAAHVTRVRLTGTTAAELARVLDDVPAAAALLADAGVDAVGLACTGASMMGGPGSERALSETIRSASGVPATNTVEALLDAFHALGIRRVGLFSPFDDRFNAAEAGMLERAGIEVVKTVGLGMTDPRRCADIPPESIAAQAAAADTARADAVFLSCANLRGFEATAPLEQVLCKPVLTSNQVMLWAMLRLARAGCSLAEGGRLFDMPMRAAA